MAARCNSLPLLRAMFLITLALATAVTPLSASTLRVFEGPGCTGKSKLISGCGCISLENCTGGYHFVYAGGQSRAQSIFRLRHKGGSRGSGRKHEELRKPRLPGREAGLLEALVYFRK